MRKQKRGEEHDTTTHLIKIKFLPTPVALLNLARMNFVCTVLQIAIRDSRASGACTILPLAVVLQGYLDLQLKRSGKRRTSLLNSNTQLQSGTSAWSDYHAAA